MGKILEKISCIRVWLRTKFLILCSFLMAGFLLAEAILWLFFPVNVASLSASVALRNNIPGLKEQITYERNIFGFRSLSMRTERKLPNTIRIICLGASTTDQPSQGTSDIWSAILEKDLQKEVGLKTTRIEVAAMGVAGAAVVDIFLWARSNLLRFQPDLVIILVGINDLCWKGGPEYSYNSLADMALDKDNNFDNSIKFDSWKAFLYRFSQVYQRLEILKQRFELYRAIRKGRALEWHSSKLPGLRENYRKFPYIEKLQRNPDPIIEFSDGLFALVRFLRGSGVRVIILGQPVLWKANVNPDEMNALWFYVNTPNGPIRPSISWLEEEMSHYNNIQRQIADTFRAPYVGLDKKVPKNLQYFFDDCHFTDLGNVKVAAEILPVVREQIVDIMEIRNHKE